MTSLLCLVLFFEAIPDSTAEESPVFMGEKSPIILAKKYLSIINNGNQEYCQQLFLSKETLEETLRWKSDFNDDKIKFFIAYNEFIQNQIKNCKRDVLAINNSLQARASIAGTANVMLKVQVMHPQTKSYVWSGVEESELKVYSTKVLALNYTRLKISIAWQDKEEVYESGLELIGVSEYGWYLTQWKESQIPLVVANVNYLQKTSHGEKSALRSCASHEECQKGLFCVNNHLDNDYFCKPECKRNADCYDLQRVFPHVKCYPTFYANGAASATTICNDFWMYEVCSEENVNDCKLKEPIPIEKKNPLIDKFFSDKTFGP